MYDWGGLNGFQRLAPDCKPVLVSRDRDSCGERRGPINDDREGKRQREGFLDLVGLGRWTINEPVTRSPLDTEEVIPQGETRPPEHVVDRDPGGAPLKSPHDCRRGIDGGYQLDGMPPTIEEAERLPLVKGREVALGSTGAIPSADDEWYTKNSQACTIRCRSQEYPFARSFPGAVGTGRAEEGVLPQRYGGACPAAARRENEPYT